MSIKAEITEWLLEFEKCVRNRNYEHGKLMFDKDSYCFGSKAKAILTNRDELIEKQWKRIWENITDFQYDLNTLQMIHSEDSNISCAMCMWHSKGYVKGGNSFPRPGRVTFIFRKNENGKWLAVHSHYSLVP